MAPTPAFTVGATTSSFTPTRIPSSKGTTPLRPPVSARPSTVRMQEKDGFFSNPFKRKPEEPEIAFMQPQAGDPGFSPLPPVPKGFGMTKSESKGAGDEEKPEVAAKDAPKTPASKGIAQKLPVIGGPGGAAAVAKRGLQLLQEDILRSAPEKAGLGRQDRSVTVKPTAGEPGYKAAAYQTVKVSSLGISPFPDDANAVGKVGGVDAVKVAAQEVKKGATAKQLKKQILSKSVKFEAEKPVVFDIPDYLKPIPEDTPRKGMTWKNYVGR